MATLPGQPHRPSSGSRPSGGGPSGASTSGGDTSGGDTSGGGDPRTDQELIRDYQVGDAQSFVQLLERYRLEVFHFLIRFVGNRAAAEDIFQDTFLQIHLAIDSFDTDRPFKPWLFTIAANKARDYLRRNRRPAAQAAHSLDDGGPGEGPGLIDIMDGELPLPPTVAEERETGELVRQVVDGMPDHLREILILAYFQQLPYKEIAAALDIPLGTVKSRLHAAVGTFAQAWKQAYGGEEAEE
ncbi:MAG: RNA polymerase sigma factor [Phycisphaeraceae bacterium]